MRQSSLVCQPQAISSQLTYARCTCRETWPVRAVCSVCCRAGAEPSQCRRRRAREGKGLYRPRSNLNLGKHAQDMQQHSRTAVAAIPQWCNIEASQRRATVSTAASLQSALLAFLHVSCKFHGQLHCIHSCLTSSPIERDPKIVISGTATPR